MAADCWLDPTQVAFVGAFAGVLGVLALLQARKAYGPALVSLLRHGNPEVFISEEEPFGGFRRDKDTTVNLFAALEHAEPTLRRLAAEVLAHTASEGAVPALIARLEDENGGVRRAVLLALAEQGSDSFPQAAIGRLEDEELEVRRAALQLCAASNHIDDETRKVLYRLLVVD